MEVEVPEEVELRWLALLHWTDLARAALVCSRWHRIANDASLWAGAFVREFGNEAASAVRSTSSVRKALDRLWGACASTSSGPDSWYFQGKTQIYRPSRTEGKEWRQYPRNVPAYNQIVANDEPWDDAEVEPHQEDLVEVRDADRAAHIEAGTRGEDGTAKPLWKATFLRHYLLRHRWLHGCDPAQVGGKGNKLADAATTTDTNAVVRVVVSGMKSSGKSHFLRALAPDQQVEDGGVNVVVVKASDGCTVALLELRRPNDWCKKLYNGAMVAGIIFMVDSTEFRPFLDGQIGSDDEYKRMEDVYKRFHGVAGQAHNSILVGVVCAHKIDLATSEAEKEELQEVVSRKLRVEGLTECGWYSSAQLSTLGTSAADLDSCLTAVEQFVTKHKRIKLWRQY